MDEHQRKLSDAFQTGCRHRLARRKLPTRKELHSEWNYSDREAKSLKGGYDCTRLTQDIIRGGAAQAAAESELSEWFSEKVALPRVRKRLARLVGTRARLMDPSGKIVAARDAGRNQYLEQGRLITGTEAKRREYSLEEVTAFVAGFEEVRVSVLHSGGKWGAA